MLLYFLPSIGIGIKKFRKSSRSSKKQRATTSKSTPGMVSANQPPAGHANNSSNEKPKRNWFLTILWTLITVVLIVAALAFVIWALTFIWKGVTSIFEPSPKYRTVVVYDRTVTVDLNNDWSEANTLLINKKEKFTFKEATVSFCVKNKRGIMVCGPPNSNPDIPGGKYNRKLWFKSEYGEIGTIKVDVFRRERQRIE